MLIYGHPFLRKKRPRQIFHPLGDDNVAYASYWSRLRVFESSDKCQKAYRSRTGGRMFVKKTARIPMNGVRLTKEHSDKNFCTGGVRTILHGGV